MDKTENNPVASIAGRIASVDFFRGFTMFMLVGGLDHGNRGTFNAIPTPSHTIWGVVTGMLLMKDWSSRKKIMTLLFYCIRDESAIYLSDGK